MVNQKGETPSSSSPFCVETQTNKSTCKCNMACPLTCTYHVWKRQMSSCLEVIGPRCFQNEFKLTTQCDAIFDPLTPSLSHLGEAPFFKVIKPFINQEIPLDEQSYSHHRGHDVSDILHCHTSTTKYVPQFHGQTWSDFIIQGTEWGTFLPFTSRSHGAIPMAVHGGQGGLVNQTKPKGDRLSCVLYNSKTLKKQNNHKWHT